VFAGETVAKDVLSDHATRFRNAHKALDLINREFLARCCRIVANKRAMSEDELKANAEAVEKLVSGMKSLPQAAE
jgi:hypothetical protein